MSKLVIVVPAGRSAEGRAVLLGDDGKARLAPFPVLATAGRASAVRHGNPERDWRRPFGHTPTGSYLVAGALPPGHPARSGALVLAPHGGDALDALRAGRTRFLLHGGTADSSGRLRPTFGGLRVSDPDLATLLRAINEAHAAGDPLSSVDVTETATPTWTANDAPPASEPRPPPRMALAALGFTRSKSRTGPTRRDFVGLALLTLTAVGPPSCRATATETKAAAAPAGDREVAPTAADREAGRAAGAPTVARAAGAPAVARAAAARTPATTAVEAMTAAARRVATTAA